MEVVYQGVCKGIEPRIVMAISFLDIIYKNFAHIFCPPDSNCSTKLD